MSKVRNRRADRTARDGNREPKAKARDLARKGARRAKFATQGR